MTHADAVAASAGSYSRDAVWIPASANDDSSVNAVIPQGGNPREPRRQGNFNRSPSLQSPWSRPIVKALAGQPPMGLGDAETGREPTAQVHRTHQSPVSGSNPQLNSGRPPSAPTATTSSSHARSRSPPG